MPEIISTFSGDGVRNLELRDIDMLPYGLIEVNMDGTIIDYIPFKSQITVEELPRVCGQNLFQDILPEEIMTELRDLVPSLAAWPGNSKNWMFVLPFPERTVRLSVVAARNHHSPRIRISLVRLSGSS